MRAPGGRAAGAAVFLAGLALYGLFFTVSEGESAVVVRLGRPVRVLTEAGPAWKWPEPIERLHRIDRRRQIADAPRTAILTRDRRHVEVSLFVVWHVDDPLLFLQANSSLEGAAATIVDMAVAAQNRELSRRDLATLVAAGADESGIDALEADLRSRVAEVVRGRLGVAVDRIGVRRITLPPENVPAALERMRADRETESARIRAEGAKAAQALRDEAHVKAQAVLRAGREEASRITAESEREAAEVFARASARDPEFFRFWTSLQAGKEALGKNSRLILDGDRLFFESLWPSSERPAALQGASTDLRRSGSRVERTERAP